MSSILLSNPFVTPQAVAHAGAPEPQVALAVAPSTATASNPNAGNTGGSNGGGFGAGSNQQAIIRMAAMAGQSGRAPDATPGSVINAQALKEGDDPFGVNLPEVEMPDPLPTSPFLTSTKVKSPLALLSRLG